MATHPAEFVSRFAFGVSSAVGALLWLAVMVVGRLGLPAWWVVPLSLLGFCVGMMIAHGIGFEAQSAARISVTRWSIWNRRVLAEFPLRSWMTIRLERTVLIVEGRGEVIARLRGVTNAAGRRGKQELDALIRVAPEGPTDASGIVIDARDGYAYMLRAGLWLASAWVAAGFHPLAFIASLLFAAYPVIAAGSLQCERWFGPVAEERA